MSVFLYGWDRDFERDGIAPNDNPTTPPSPWCHYWYEKSAINLTTLEFGVLKKRLILEQNKYNTKDTHCFWKQLCKNMPLSLQKIKSLQYLYKLIPIIKIIFVLLSGLNDGQIKWTSNYSVKHSLNFGGSFHRALRKICRLFEIVFLWTWEQVVDLEHGKVWLHCHGRKPKF